MASLGVATSHLPNGTMQLMSSCFRLPIALTDKTISKFSGLSGKAKALKKTDIYIWDKTPMSPGKALTAIERPLKDMTKNTIDLFGGFFCFCFEWRFTWGEQWKLLRASFVCPFGDISRFFPG